MAVVLLMVLSFAGYLVAYHTYGKYLARKIFKLNDANIVPSKELEDGQDYVPTKKAIIFGHHYTSIAGTGPIIGPAIGIIWGWVPALVWVFVGSIVMGAVHDLGSLVISLRNQGRSISDITGKYINIRVRYIFFLIIFFALLIVIAIFGVVIAVIFSMYPGAVFAVWMQIPIAIVLGYVVYKKRGNLKLFTAIAVLLMYATVLLGDRLPMGAPASVTQKVIDKVTAVDDKIPGTAVPSEVTLKLSVIKDKNYINYNNFENDIRGSLSDEEYAIYGAVITKASKSGGIFGVPPIGLWTIVLLIYVFFASTLPVTTLLQPRDYINSWQLMVAMALLIMGVFASGIFGDLRMGAPAVNVSPEGAPPMWPFLFVTIACGAISGFHSLVSTGTSSKQISKESDALFVGYGSMLLESVLAVLVIIAVAAGIGNSDIWQSHYSSWGKVTGGLGAKISAFVIGSSNMMKNIGIPENFGKIIIGVFIASFAGTTLDSATRIQRYAISEIFSGTRASFLSGKYVATFIAIASAAALAFATGTSGTGALTLWPMFGAVNQLLGALALIVITVYLKNKNGKKYLFTLIPCVVMLVMTVWSLVFNEISFIKSGKWLLTVMNGAIFLLAFLMILESFNVLRKKVSVS